MPVVRVINPARKPKHNPLGAVLISAMNGSRKPRTTKEKSTMAHKKPVRTAKQKAAFKAMLAARGKKNGIVVAKRGSRSVIVNRGKRHSARRNGLTVGGFGLKQVAEGGVGVALGVATTGKAAQIVGGDKYNQGLLGYALTGALGIAGGYAINRWAKRPVLATGFVFGTFGAIARRAYVDYKFGDKLQNLIGAPKMADFAFSPSAHAALNGYYHTTGGNGAMIGDRLGAEEPMPFTLMAGGRSPMAMGL
jgi:hypothetical protein